MAFLKKHAWSLLSGLLLTVSFPNIFHHEFFYPGVLIAWAALLPLLKDIAGLAPGAAFRKGYACGFLFFVLSLNWITNVGPMGPGAYPAWLGLAAYCALYPALFASFYARLQRRGLPLEALWAPALWTLLEYARELLLTGFPWVSLGSSQALNPLMRSLASVTGVHGLHFAVALGNLCLFRAWQGGWKRRDWWAAAFAAAFLAACWGAAALPRSDPGPRFKAAVLQGNVNQDQAWTEDYRHEILTTYGALSQEALQGGAKLILWPESTFPAFFNEMGPEAGALVQFAKNNKVSLMIGSSLILEQGQSFGNAAVFIDSRGNTSSYSKRHLVPFGEFIPFRRHIPVLDRVMRQMGLLDFREGLAGGEFIDGDIRAVPLICYESIYGAQAREKAEGMLAIITLDTWFGNSAAPRHHLMHAMLRAAEGGRFVVRAAATGISAVLGPDGALLASVPLNQKGLAMAEVDSRAFSIYGRLGNWFVWACALLLALPIFIFRKKAQ